MYKPVESQEQSEKSESVHLHGRRIFTNELEKADTLSRVIWKHTFREMFVFKDNCMVLNL